MDDTQNIMLIVGLRTGEMHVTTALGGQIVEHCHCKACLLSTIELVNMLEQKKITDGAKKLPKILSTSIS